MSKPKLTPPTVKLIDRTTNEECIITAFEGQGTIQIGERIVSFNEEQFNALAEELHNKIVEYKAIKKSLKKKTTTNEGKNSKNNSKNK